MGAPPVGRPPRRAARLPAAAPALAAIAALAGVVLLLALPHQLQDLDVYRAGGSAVLHGRDPYDVVSGPARLPFTYPPFAALAAAPLAALPRWLAALLLLAADGLATAAVVRWLDAGRRLPPAGTATAAVAALLLLEPLRSTAAYGQVNLLLLGLVVTDVGRPGRRHAGVLTGVAAAVKLTPLAVTGWLLVTGQWRAAVRSVLGFAVAAALAAAIDPAASRRYWLHLAGDSRRVGPASYGSNEALSGLLARHGASPRGGAALLLAAALGVGGLLVARRWYDADRPVSLVLAGLTGLVVSPISWSHHWVWLLPAAGVLARHRGALRGLAAAAVVVAVVGLPSWWERGGTREAARGGLDWLLGESYLALALAVLVTCAVRPPQSPTMRLPSIAS